MGSSGDIAHYGTLGSLRVVLTVTDRRIDSLCQSTGWLERPDLKILGLPVHS